MRVPGILLSAVLLLAAVLFNCTAEASSRPAAVKHDLKVMLMPSGTFLTAEDTITLPEPSASLVTFRLHRDLSVSVFTPGAEIVSREETEGPVPLTAYSVRLPEGLTTFTVSYQGRIYHPVSGVGKEQSRGFSSTPGIISPEGVFLSGSSFWYPVIDDRFVSFRLTATLPEGWSSVSQGARTESSAEAGQSRTVWDSPEPQDEIFLVANRFHEYSRSGSVTAMAFLLSQDQALATRYLDATADYISFYSRLIGSYPYRKFALVENFWETGFGMPSFTLLGSKVIRLPFIITTSYPHEILHNWWGNSVFPSYETGNWSEGLTAYLADHLLKEKEDSAAEYRYASLQKYADYVRGGRDFPLSRFTARHSSAEEAVGYGKSLMFFHMLRRQLGDTIFIAGLRQFYRENRFGFASFQDLQSSFEQASGKDLSHEFEQWTTRTGAPELRLTSAQVTQEQEGFSLSLTIDQKQPHEEYRLRIPVAVTLSGAADAYQTVIEMDSRKMLYRLSLPLRPLRVDIDPEFDVFRRLDREEMPPALTQALGATKLLVVLPADAPENMYDAYLDLARAFAGYGPDSVSIYKDSEIGKLPDDRAVVVFGRKNSFYNTAIAALGKFPFEETDTGFVIDSKPVPREGHAVILSARNPSNPDMALVIVDIASPDIVPSLSRKLPHYHKQSYLAFRGPEAENVLKGRWTVTRSPLTIFFPDASGTTSEPPMAKLSPRTPLEPHDNAFSADRLSETVSALCSPAMEGRGCGTDGIDLASRYLAELFQKAELQPVSQGDSGFLQSWNENVPGLDRTLALNNVVGMLPGSNPVLSRECVVIGAHYDHLGSGGVGVKEENKGKQHPGADDNASGVSLLIETGRVQAAMGHPAPRTLVFAAFTAEEAARLGSRHFVESVSGICPDGVFAMLNFDTVGRLRDNRLHVIGGDSASEWRPLLDEAAREAGMSVSFVREPLDSSDQTSFHEAGIPAVQFFTGPHEDYHSPTDTPDKLNLEGMEKIGSFVTFVIGHLAGRTEPLGPALDLAKHAEPKEPARERKAGLGIVPDFSFQGVGCRLGGVVPGSPAEAAGLQQGDVITGINSTGVTGLKDLSTVLASLKPGDRVEIRFLREGQEKQAEAELRQR